MKDIVMVDLKSQYLSIKADVDTAIQDCLNNSSFIKGEHVTSFQRNFESYLKTENVITCANGTDALQIAMMSLNLQKGDEVIVPAFTYVATVEVIALLGLTPVYVDVEYDSFNISVVSIKRAITEKTRLIVPVHLFGQCCDMSAILQIAQKHNLYIIEDVAQAIGADYLFDNKRSKKAGTIGNIGCTSFFPSKNLGCYGDGGALMTGDAIVGEKIRMIANHGQKTQYYHEVIGVNSRLDSIQAGVLNVKLKHIETYIDKRQVAAEHYNNSLQHLKNVIIPHQVAYSTHVFHQYTLKIIDGKRDKLKEFLSSKGIPSMIYYPLPIHEQKAFIPIGKIGDDLTVSEKLCTEVLSLPMHTELDVQQLSYITNHILSFFDNE
jgi:dTDP-4-amino-4,6-dideoxygalactose transaminase